MIKLRKEIQALLKTIHPRIYHIDTKIKTGYPYIVYDLSKGSYDNGLEIFNLDIDVWDNPKDDDSTEIERLSQAVWDRLHKYYGINEDMQLSIYRQTRLTVHRDDKQDYNPKIKRRTLIFNVRYYDRSDA